MLMLPGVLLLLVLLLLLLNEPSPPHIFFFEHTAVGKMLLLISINFLSGLLVYI